MKSEELGSKLRNARISKNYSVEFVAKGLECDSSHILDIENGSTKPSRYEITFLNKLYDTDFKAPFKPGLYTYLTMRLIPFFLSLVLLILVNPFISLYDFNGEYIPLFSAMDVSYNNGQMPSGAIGLLIAFLVVFLSVLLLFVAVFIKKGYWIFVTVVELAMALTLTFTLCSFHNGVYIIVVAWIIAIGCSVYYYFFQRKISKTLFNI